MGAKDHFSRQSADYQQFRPRYPPELFAHLAGLAPGRALALDVATGNGQAAGDLAVHFERVLASDISANQLKHRAPHPRIQYLRHAAENHPIRSGVADLLTVAQSAHWFDFPPFYAEARRVLRVGGIVALWTYSLLRVDAPTDAVIARFYAERVGRFWPPERRLVEEQYRTLPFPLAELPAPVFTIEASFSLETLVNYVGTWSAVDRCRHQTGVDPLPELAAELKSFWTQTEMRSVRWPVHLRIGRV